MRRIYFYFLLLLIMLVAITVGLHTRADLEKRIQGGSGTHLLARLSEEVSVRAAGRGNPYINLSDGHDLLTQYEGDPRLVEALEQNQAKPLSLASADFDEDGVPDLIAGYEGVGGGIVALHRGNIDAIYPNSPEARQRRVTGNFTDAPFLSPALVYQAPEAADFLGAGDFDGDGHWDVVTAKPGCNKLDLLSGDGKGGLQLSRQIPLPGKVTALTVGEINRRDGLDDVVVGINGRSGAKVLVFEGPVGALKAEPEVFAAPEEITSLALGQLDDSYEYDLAVAAGHQLMMVHGRDRKLSLDAERQREVSAAVVVRRDFPFAIRSIATGDFTGSRQDEIAVLVDDARLRLLRPVKGQIFKSRGLAIPRGKDLAEWRVQEITTGDWSQTANLVRARISSQLGDSLLVVDSINHEAEVIAMTEAAVNNWALSGGTVEGVVRSRLEARDAPVAVLPMRLNGDALSDLVVVWKGKCLPSVLTTAAVRTFTVTNTNDSGPGSLRQAIADADNSLGLDEIRFSIGSGAQSITPTSQPFGINDPVIIDGTTQPGYTGKPLIELNGANVGGNQFGLYISGGGCTVRGLAINRFQTGIFIQTKGGNIITGNYMGTDVTGTAKLGNHNGVVINSSANNIVGGTTAAARNLISGNYSAVLINTSGGTGNQVQGNYMGTDVTGTAKLGNSFDGLGINIGAFNNIVGGTTAGAGNLISGNDAYGVDINGSDNTGNQVQGNFIGTDVTGTAKLDNRQGVFIYNAPNNTIGGTTTGARNLISGNNSRGVVIVNGATDNQIQGNLIGTDASGTGALGNGDSGVFITQAPGNIISGNTISANNQHGVAIGLRINDLTGREITGETGVIVQGNFIGTDITGKAPLGNSLCGILVDADSFTNTIDGNLIAFNGTNGVCIPDNNNPAVRILIINNIIHSNTLLGIDLGPPGPTPNPFNRLTGANLLQNFPELASATISGGSAVRKGVSPAAASMTMTGIMTAKPGTTYTLQFFYGSDCSFGGAHEFFGSIPIFLGSQPVTTDSSGTASYNITLALPATVTNGGFVNATATDPVGNTSEFSACTQVTGTVPATGPQITNVSKAGKNLSVIGSGFIEGAKIFIDGEQRKTIYESATTVTGKKAAKGLPSGAKIKVRNPDGSESNEWIYQ